MGVLGPGALGLRCPDLDLPGSITRFVVHDWPVDGTRITHLRDLVAAGATYPEAHQVVAEMDRLTRGAYADTSGLSAEDVHLLRAAAQLRRLDGVVASHISAAAIWQLPLRESDLGTVHLSPRSGRRGKPKAGSGYRPAQSDRRYRGSEKRRWNPDNRSRAHGCRLRSIAARRLGRRRGRRGLPARAGWPRRIASPGYSGAPVARCSPGHGPCPISAVHARRAQARACFGCGCAGWGWDPRSRCRCPGCRATRVLTS